MSYVLGVDGGNTKTIALVARLDGTIVGAGRGGCGDIYAAGSAAYGSGRPEVALAAVDEAAGGALAAGGVSRDQLQAAVFSMAGADWPEDFALLEASFGERGYCGRDGQIQVVNDAIGALRAGSPDGTGVVVACGTGAATGARAPDGQTWHASFWQESCGACEIGRRAWCAVVRAALWLEPETRLTDRILETMGESTVEGALHRMTARDHAPHPTKIGRFARLVLDEAMTGDAVALRIVEEQGTILGEYAVVAARRVGIASDPFPLVFTGGVFRHPGEELPAAVTARVRQSSPLVRPLRSRLEPGAGAVLLALEAVGYESNQVITERLTATMPSADLFAT